MMTGPLTYTADVLWKSGTVGLITVGLFFVCLGVALERLLFWSRLWGFRALIGFPGRGGIEHRAGRVEQMVRDGRFEDAGAEARRAANPALRLMGAALEGLRRPEAWHSVRERALVEELGGGVNLGRRFLMTSIQCFGLLGMLGTCKGLYTQLSGFSALAANAGSIHAAMGGMGEAFTTTLVGLSAAVLATLLYVPNEIAVDRFRRQLRLYDHRIRAALLEHAGGHAGTTGRPP